MKCLRADDLFTSNVIIEEIWCNINVSRLVISDLTDKNPNVFYETGIAHALGKPVILITQSLKFVPFDLRHIRVIEYEYTPQGMKTFEDALARTISNVLNTPLISDELFKSELVSDSFPDAPTLDIFPNSFVTNFVLNRLNESFIRKMAIELLFKRGCIDENTMFRVLNEGIQAFTKIIPLCIAKYQHAVSERLIERLLKDDRVVALSGLNAAFALVKLNIFNSNIYKHATQHSSWEVLHYAINKIIEIDDEFSIPTLLEFSDVSYHVSVQNIRKYIDEKADNKSLPNEYVSALLEMLNKFMKLDMADHYKEWLMKTIEKLSSCSVPNSSLQSV